MALYLLAFVQPDGDPPPAEALADIMREVDVVNQDIRSAGGWVFAGGLHPPGAATVVLTRGDEVLMTDGPFVEGKEYIGGITIVEAPDLDVALGWAGRLSRATTLPIEVRPFQGQA